MPYVTVDSPFSDQEVTEVPLRDAPLVRVLSQLRFPRLTAFAAGGDQAANAFAIAMAADYPILDEQREMAVTITPEGVKQAPGSARVWKLRQGDETWQISFGDSFLAVDTSAYVSREDFRDRVVDAWQRFVEVVRPPFIERVGVRYINRIADTDTIENLRDLVRQDALGGLTVALEGGVTLNHSMHEALYHFDDRNGLHARWGILPADAVLDPAVPPVPGASWVLDLDAFETGRNDVAPEHVASQVERLAERAYRYFRWVVTPTFLARFGGDLE
jgi:uncharacterized protein (TIGR04255 family)